MTELVACLSTGKGTWAEVYQLIRAEPWEKVILVTNQFGKEKFQPLPNVELIVLDLDAPLEKLGEDMKKELGSRIKGLEVAINISSGTGKEHMALISSLMKLGVGMRIVAFNSGVKEV